ncbi:MAG: 4Fe-4S binding protein [Acidobacteria bacterium]|nr:4Fe-4S binding protein [Acidobacteriota bacterium]
MDPARRAPFPAEAAIHWMSGTGNALRLAQAFAGDLAAKGVAVRLSQAAPRPEPPPPGAWLALFFPTHGFTTPWPVLRLCLALPLGRGRPASVVSTRAGWWMGACLRGLSGSAAWLPALLLAIKGYRVRGVLSVDMPSNWITVHPSLNAAHVSHFIDQGRIKTHAFARRLLEGRRHLWSVDNLFELICGMALAPVSLGYLLFGRPLFAKLFMANERCDACGLCALHCPQGAIRMKAGGNWPYWTLHCESCMRCMNLCPRQAVEASHSLGVLLNLAAGAPVVALLLALALPGWTGGPVLQKGLPGFLLNYAWYLLALVATYALAFQLMRWRPLRLAFAFTTLTRWFRRYRMPGLRPSELPGDPMNRKRRSKTDPRPVPTESSRG